MPQHQVLLTWSFCPVHPVRICPCVGYQEFGSVDQEEVFQRKITYAPDPLVDAGYVDLSSEYPVYLEVGVVVQKVFSQIPRVAAVLLECVCPHHHPAFPYLGEAAYDQRKEIAESHEDTVEPPADCRYRFLDRHHILCICMSKI